MTTPPDVPVFSDEDLKRLKAYMEDTRHTDGAEMGVDYEVVDALLARMSAAEELIKGAVFPKDFDEANKIRFRAWLAICGRTEK